MSTYIEIDKINKYPKEYVSSYMLKHIRKDGLITPILIENTYDCFPKLPVLFPTLSPISSELLPNMIDIHPDDRERYMAFLMVREELAKEGIETTPYIIAVYWEELDEEEQEEYTYTYSYKREGYIRR